MTRRQRRVLDRFFRRHLLPLAGREDVAMRSAAAGARESYWVVRERGPMRPADFELVLRDREAIAGTLDEAWRGTPLEGLGRRFTELSPRFRTTELDAELSSSVYEMF